MITRTLDIWQWTSNGNPIESKQLWVDLQRHYQNSLNNGTTLTSGTNWFRSSSCFISNSVLASTL